MSAPTPPGTPKPASRWASRMGAAVRRSSTILSLARPSTPSSDPDADAKSVKSVRRSTSREVIQTPPPTAPSPPAVRVSTPQPQPPPPSMPTPISESPAREEAAMKADVVGPSPLTRIATEPAVTPEAEAPKPVEGTESGTAPAAEAAQATSAVDSLTSPVGYVPPPVIDSSIGNPGAFTDLPEDLPQPTEEVDPFAASNTPAMPPPPPAEEPVAAAEPEPVAAPAEEPAEVKAEETAQPAPEPAPVEEPLPDPVSEHPAASANPGAYTDDVDDLPEPTVIADPYAEAPAMEHSTSYFDKPMAESMLDFDMNSPEAEVAPHVPEPAVSHEFIEAVETHVSEMHTTETHTTEVHTSETHTTVVQSDTAESREVTTEHETVVQAPEPQVETEQAPTKPQEPDLEHGEAASYYRGDVPAPAVESLPAEAESTPQPGPEQAPIPTFIPVVPVSKDTYDSTVTYGLPEYESHDVWGGVKRDEAVTMVGDSWVPVIPAAHVPGPETQKVVVQDDVHEHAAGPEAAGPSMPIPILGRAEETAENGHGNGAVQSDDSSFKMPNPHPVTEVNEDPFADPVIPIVAVPLAEEIYRTQVEPPTETHGIVMPLPAFSEVAAPGSIRQAPSHSSYGAGKVNMETDERTPLLGGSTATNKGLDEFLRPSHATSQNNYATISPMPSSSSRWHRHTHQNGGHSHSASKLHELGWLEYALPDGSVYYVHPTRKITTDAGLRVDYVLDAVEVWCERYSDETRDVGVECWLREVDAKEAAKKAKAAASAKARSSAAKGKAKKGDTPPVFFERYWVDHHARTVVKASDDEQKVIGYTRGHVHGHGARGKGKQSSAHNSPVDDDQLDQEYRFWAFIEAHPAHTTLPHKAKTEALDILQWAWTDRLLPSIRPVQPPFTQAECQELATLLRSVNNDNEDHGIQTRVVARILLRVAYWRQSFFRPNKPLPKDVGGVPGQMPVQRRTASRVIFDFVLSCLCLGIPYVFLQRATRLSTRMDEESGLLRGPTPMVVIGAATCLVAAIVLSASVTLLSLPGLDSVARTTGMVAVVFAAFAMAATGVAVLRHKADMERPLSRMTGIEGLMLITRRSVAMSLPLVLLSYAVIAFVTAIVIYSFRGSPNKLPGGRDTFHDYMKWTVVGVVGALAGILTTSMIVLGS